MLVVAGVLGVAALLSGRMLLGAHAHLEAAHAERARSDHAAEARQLRRALAYYLPVNPWLDRAADRLYALSVEHEQRGQLHEALRTAHELRSALLALRTGYAEPYAALVRRVEARILALTPKHPQAARILRTRTGLGQLASALAAREAPHAGWVALGLLGFALWIGGALAMIYYGLTSEGRARPGWTWRVALVAVGLLLFLLGMGRA